MYIVRGIGDYDEACGGCLMEKLDLDIGHNQIDNDTSDDHYTPPYIFEELNLTFDLDVCSPTGGLPWIPAKKSLSIIDDGLSVSWHGNVWCNPPYSGIKPWIRKFIDHNHGIALLLLSRNQWLIELWQKADGILLLDHNLKFMLANGKSRSIMAQTALFAFGADNVEAMRQSNLGFVR